MPKIILSDITTEFNSVEAINARLAQLEVEFQDKVHYRMNPVGEPNQMWNDIDMDSYQLLNLGAPVDPANAVRKQDLDAALGGIFSHALLQNLGADDHPQYFLRSEFAAALPTLAGVTLGPNVLDHYEEGTIVPTLGASVADGTHTYFYQHGRFTRIGRVVEVNGIIVVSAKDAAINGNLKIRGAMPYASANEIGIYGIGTVGYVDGINPVGTMTLGCDPNSQEINVLRTPIGGNTGSSVHTDISGAAFQIIFNFKYTV